MSGWVEAGRRGVVTALAAALTVGTAGAARAGGSPARAAGGIISTVAGGVGGPAPGRTVAVDPCGAGSDSSVPTACDALSVGEQLYVTDLSAVAFTLPGGVPGSSPGSVVRTVSIATGRVATPVGDGVTGFAGDGGPAAAAELDQPGGVSTDTSGNLVVADTGNSRIRVAAARSGTFYGRRMVAGRIYTVVGGGAARSSDDGGPAGGARLFSPAGVRVDQAGNLVIAQDGENGQTTVPALIRVVAERSGRFYGRAMAAGHIYTIAGQGGALGWSSLAIRLDHAGNILAADGFDDQVKVVAARSATFYGQQMIAGHVYTVAGGGTGGLGDGGPATKAELSPTSVTVDSLGNLIIADAGVAPPQVGRVRVVAERSGTFYHQRMTAGDIYTVAGGTSGGLGDGGPATSASLSLSQGAAVAVDSAGNLVVTDSGHFRVRVVAARSGTFYRQKMTSGDIYTILGTGTLGITGDGGPATRAQLNGPFAATVASDHAGDLAIEGSSRVRFVPASSETRYGRKMTAGDIYTVAGTGTEGFSGDGGPATKAELDGPTAVALDHAGNLVIGDLGAERIRVVAAKDGRFYGRTMTAGDIYTVAGSGSWAFSCSTPPFSGDGGPATKAHLCAPNAVAVDGSGNVLVADSDNNRVRLVATVSGTFYGQKMTAGDIYTIAGDGNPGLAGDGGPAVKAELAIAGYAGLATDSAGNLVVTSQTCVRVVAARTGTFYGKKMVTGDIYTVAGRGTSTANGVPATTAKLSYADAVAVDGTGNLIIQDSGASLVRVVAATSGTFYGKTMVAGDIYTVAGGGHGGLGDGGPATAASLAGPDGVAVSGSHDLLIAEADSGRIQLVTG